MEYQDLQNDIALGIKVLSSNITIPPYEGIIIAIDDADPKVQSDDGRIIINKSSLYIIEEYSNEYHVNRTKGFSWINLKLAGLYENKLVVLITYPKQNANVNFTSINYSGPYNDVDTGLPNWDFSKMHVFV